MKQKYRKTKKEKKHVLEKPIFQANMKYIKGVYFERMLKHALEERDYYVVRSAGSHGSADLVAILDDTVLLIQCKVGFVVDAKEIQSLRAIARQYEKIIPVIAKLHDRKITLIDVRKNEDITSKVLAKTK